MMRWGGARWGKVEWDRVVEWSGTRGGVGQGVEWDRVVGVGWDRGWSGTGGWDRALVWLGRKSSEMRPQGE